MLIPVTGKWSSFQGEATTLSVTVQLFNVKVKGSDLPAILNQYLSSLTNPSVFDVIFSEINLVIST